MLAQQCRTVGRVKNQEVLIRQSAAKMSAQHRQYVVFRVDDGTKHPVPLLKAKELGKMAGLVSDAALQRKRRANVRVAQHLHSTRTFVKTAADESQQDQVLFFLGGKKAYRYAFFHHRAQPRQAVGYTLGVRRVGGDAFQPEQRRLPLARAQHSRGNLVPGITFKNTAEEPRKAAVVAVSGVAHMRRVRHVSASSRTMRAAAGAATPCAAS